MQQAALFRRERHIVVNVVLGGYLRNLRDLRETIGVSSLAIDRVLLRVILSQMAQISQMNAASCIISQRKTVSGWCSFVVYLRNQRDLRETLGFLLWQ